MFWKASGLAQTPLEPTPRDGETTKRPSHSRNPSAVAKDGLLEGFILGCSGFYSLKMLFTLNPKPSFNPNVKLSSETLVRDFTLLV